jgi:hypothetical protein
VLVRIREETPRVQIRYMLFGSINVLRNLIMLWATASIFLVSVALMVLSYRHENRMSAMRVKKMEQYDSRNENSDSRSLEFIPCYIGGSTGKKAKIAIGNRYIFLCKPWTAPDNFVAIGYDEIVSVEIESPDRSYVMTADVAGIATNLLASAITTMNIVIVYAEMRRSYTIVLGSFSLGSAQELIRRIDYVMEAQGL